MSTLLGGSVNIRNKVNNYLMLTDTVAFPGSLPRIHGCQWLLFLSNLLSKNSLPQRHIHAWILKRIVYIIVCLSYSLAECPGCVSILTTSTTNPIGLYRVKQLAG